jgi:iron complex transport system substrate-binding protein
MRKRFFLALVLFFSGLLLRTVEVGAVAASGRERLLTDETGRAVKVPLIPRRIVSLAPNVTEILFFLGLDTEIAGVTDFCDYPEAALKKPRVGGYINPNLEKIILLKPDLIFWIKEGSRREALQGLAELGYPVYVTDPKGFDGVTKTIRNIGEVVGRQEKAAAIVKDMTAKKNGWVALTAPLPKPRVYFQVGTASTVTVGKGTLADDLIRFAGGSSISGDESLSYPSYGIEAILSKAPEIIIVSSMEGKKDHSNLIQKWSHFAAIPAVKKKAVYVVDSNLVDRPAPRIMDGLEALVRIFHPDTLGTKR